MSHNRPRHHGRHCRRRGQRPRAFAVIFALFLIALVGAALLALTSLMTSDARRSTRGAVDAQLRQLLHAGAVAAVERMRSANELNLLPRRLVAEPGVDDRLPGGPARNVNLGEGATQVAREGDVKARFRNLLRAVHPLDRRDGAGVEELAKLGVCRAAR